MSPPALPRIAVGGLVHETNTFAPLPTTLADFDTHGSSLPILRGAALLDAFPNGGGSIGGVMRALQTARAEIVPLLWAAAQPGGMVTAAAFTILSDAFIAGLGAAGPLDAVVLDLHGAMVVEGIEDAEGWLLNRIRQVVGPQPFIAAVLDFHGNLSAEMVRDSDLLLAYRTYPHVDMEAAGTRLVRETLGWLAKCARPAKAFAQGRYLIPIHAQSTLINPMADLVALQEQSDREHDALTSVLPGFPPADIADCGPSVLAYAPDQHRADAALTVLTRALTAAEPAFGSIGLRPGAEAVAHALQRADAVPVILVDTQDNPGAGATSDTMGMVRELLAQSAPDALVAVINDAAAAAAAHAEGVGACVQLALGGKGSSVGSGPLMAKFTVEALGDGHFAGSGGYYNGDQLNFGPMALLRIEASGVRVIVGTNRAQAGTRAIITHLGVDPGSLAILGLKSSVHFLADFAGLTSEIHYAAFPGLNTADPAAFSYRNLRAGIRRRPCGRTAD
jgi:microcystin degradation protein MlrC